MKKKLILAGLAVLSLTGCFLPIATAGSFYVNLHHLGGVAYLLYLISSGFLVFSIVSLYKTFKYQKFWGLLTCLLGFFLTVCVTYGGLQYLNYMIENFIRFKEESLRFEQSFLEEWNRSLRKFEELEKRFPEEWKWKPDKDEKNTVQRISKNIESLQQEIKELGKLKASPGMGAIFLAVSFGGGIGIMLFARDIFQQEKNQTDPL